MSDGAEIIDFPIAMQNQGHASGGPPPMQQQPDAPQVTPFDMDLNFRMRLNGVTLTKELLAMAQEAGRSSSGIGDLAPRLRKHARFILEKFVVPEE